MQLTDVGKIIEFNLNSIPKHFPNTIIDEYIIMPNHIHGIIVIDNDWAFARTAPTKSISDVICTFKSNCVNNNLKRIDNAYLNESGKIWQRNYEGGLDFKENLMWFLLGPFVF